MPRNDDGSFIANFLAKAATHASALINNRHRAVVALDGGVGHDDAIEGAYIDTPYAARAVFLQYVCLWHFLVLDDLDDLAKLVLNGEDGAVFSAHAAIDAPAGVDAINFFRYAGNRIGGTHRLADAATNAGVKYKMGHPTVKRKLMSTSWRRATRKSSSMK